MSIHNILYSKDYITVELMKNSVVTIKDDVTEHSVYLDEHDLPGVIDALKNAVAILEKADAHKKALSKIENERLVF